MRHDLINVLKTPEPVYVRAMLPIDDVITLFARRTQHLGVKIQSGEFKVSELLAYLLPRTSIRHRRATLTVLAIAYVGYELRTASHHLVPGSYVFTSHLENILAEMVNDPEIIKRMRLAVDFAGWMAEDAWAVMLDEVGLMFREQRIPAPAQLEEVLAAKRRLSYHAWTITDRCDRKHPEASSMIIEIGSDFRVEALKNRLREMSCPIMEEVEAEGGTDGFIFHAFAPRKHQT